MMHRRDFARHSGAALAVLAVPPVAWAQHAYEPGRDYRPLGKPAPTEASGNRIEVVEFFSYACPHCASFESTFDAWVRRSPKDVQVRRVPVPFVADHQVLQRMYYALEALGQLEALHAKVFLAIHQERKRFATPAAAAEWVAAHGVDPAKFNEQFSSFTVASKVQRATQLTTAYAVEGVPALGVAGRFYTDSTLTRSMERALQVVDYLVAEIRKGR